jgi:hypothetical protein
MDKQEKKPQEDKEKEKFMVRVGSRTPRKAVLAGASPRLKPLVVAIGLALGAAGTPAMAAVYTVTNLSDSLPGSLRDAVTQANATIGVPDVITFAPGVTGTIALLVSGIDVDDQLSINGPGAGLLTITPAAGQYALGTTKQLAISGVTFAGGSGVNAAVVSGLGLASLTLQSCVFSNNSGTVAGAVFNYFGSAVFISDSTFNNNTATGTGSAAGAVLGAGGTLSITNSTFSGNQGPAGAIFSALGTFVMTNSTISGNTGSNTAGGIYLLSLAVPAEIRNSTLSGNTATSGAAGGILVTQTGSGSSTLNLTSTIVANSTSNPGTVDIARLGTTTINATNSLIRNGAGAINGTNTANIFGIDPLLGLLQNNGGPTKTQALLPGSPAIDTGSNPLALTTDQRGAGFARTAGSGTDIGAYEIQAPVVATATATAIPTLSEWGTVALAALLGGATLFTGLGRRRRDG